MKRRNLLKIGSVLCATLIVALSSGIRNRSVFAEGNAVNEKRMICTFDTYSDVVYADILSTGCRATVNKDMNYIKEGKGSLKIERVIASNSVEYSFATEYSNTKVMDIENIETIFISIYNANDYACKLVFYMTSASGYLGGSVTTLMPNAWTTFEYQNNRACYIDTTEYISRYKFIITSEESQPMTFYFDDFYAIKSTEKVVTTQKNFAGNEILNFDDVGDLSYLTYYGAQNRTIPILKLNTLSAYADEKYSLMINVLKITKYVVDSDVWTDGSVPYYAKEIGFKLRDDVTKTLELSAENGVKGLTMKVYHTHSLARTFHLKVKDKVNKTVESTLTLQPNQWGELTINDFGFVDLNNIVEIAFTYESYQTFEDYNIYVDSLRVIK